MKMHSFSMLENIQNVNIKEMFSIIKYIAELNSTYRYIELYKEEFVLQNKFLIIEIYFLFDINKSDTNQYILSQRLVVIKELKENKISFMLDSDKFISPANINNLNLCSEKNTLKICKLLTSQKLTHTLFTKNISLDSLKAQILTFNISLIFTKETKGLYDLDKKLFFSLKDMFNNLITISLAKYIFIKSNLNIITDIDSFEFNYLLDLQNISFFDFFINLFSVLKPKQTETLNLFEYFPQINIESSDLNKKYLV